MAKLTKTKTVEPEPKLMMLTGCGNSGEETGTYLSYVITTNADDGYATNQTYSNVDNTQLFFGTIIVIT